MSLSASSTGHFSASSLSHDVSASGLHRRNAVLSLKTLVIRVHAAEHLLAKDLNGRSDPYARVTIDDVVVGKTKTKKGDLNPMWEEEFVVPLDDVSNMEQSGYEIKVEIFNEYKFGKMSSQIKHVGKQSFLGQITMPLATVLKEDFSQGQHKFELQKRSAKSHVRGNLYCSFIVSNRKNDEGSPSGAETRDTSMKYASTRDPVNPSEAGAMVANAGVAAGGRATHRRVSSYSSLSQLADWSRKNSVNTLTSGLYSLHVTLVKATDLPEVSSSKTVSVQFTVSVGRKETPCNEYCLNDQKEGVLQLGDTTKVVPVMIRSLDSMPTVRMTMEIQTGLFVRNVLGQANIKLQNLPILDDNHTLVNDLKPFEIFIERRKIHGVVPGSIKLDEYSSMARLRLKAWLSLEAEGEGVGEDPEAEEAEEEVEPEPGLPDTPEKLPDPFSWVLCTATLPFGVHKLRSLCFDKDSPVFKKFVQQKGWKDMQIGDWVDGKRDVNYILPKTAFMREAPAIETQTYEVKSKNAFVVHIESRVPSVPNGKDFVTHTQYMLTGQSPTSSTLLVSSEVRFLRSILLRSVISKSTKTNMIASYAIFMEIMNKHRATKKGKAGSDSKDSTEGGTQVVAAAGATVVPMWVWALLTALATLLVFAVYALARARSHSQTLEVNLGRLEEILAAHAVGASRDSLAGGCGPGDRL